MAENRKAGPLVKRLAPVALLLVVAAALAAVVMTRRVEPDVAMPVDREGKPLVLVEDGSRLTLLHFWATWCGPCRPELPELVKFAEKHAGQGIRVVLVSTDPDFGAVDTFQESIGLQFETFLDPTGDYMRSWKVRGLPTTFVIDRSGNALAEFLGPVDWSSRIRESDILSLAATSR